MTYSEKLRDPRWQKMRLQVMERDGFECQKCGDTKSTLNVHHIAYRRGLNPWEYENDMLVTLCEPCHGQVGDETCALLFGRLMMALDLNNAVSFFKFALRNRCAESMALLELSDDPEIAVDAICDITSRVRLVRGLISGSDSAELLTDAALDARRLEGWRKCYDAVIKQVASSKTDNDVSEPEEITEESA